MKKLGRKAQIKRKTQEVEIKGDLNIDGEGRTSIVTGFPPLDHLLTLFGFHGFFDLHLEAKGDLRHHIIEDIGIALGKAFSDALKDKKGIKRYGFYSVVMDKVVVEVNLDISGRPGLFRKILGEEENQFNAFIKTERFDNTDFSFQDAEDFLEGFVNHARISVVYIIKSAQGDLHHLLEALFKALGKSLDEATTIDSRRRGVPSTKGVID